VYAFEHSSKKKSEVRIGSSFSTDLDLEREFKLRADSEPNPGTSKKFNLNIFAFLKVLSNGAGGGWRVVSIDQL